MSKQEPAVDRIAVFGERPGTAERIAPGFFEPGNVRVHVQRYKWAASQAQDCRILDLACGTGYGLRIMEKAGPRRLIGLDLNKEALAFATRRYELVSHLVRGDAQHLPFRDETFDVATAFEIIEHVHDQTGVLGELRRVLVPGGRLCLSTPNSELSSGSNPYHVHELHLEELEHLVRQAGFRIAGVRGQAWQIAGRLFEAVPGFRRAAYELKTRLGIREWHVHYPARPEVWCVLAIRE